MGLAAIDNYHPAVGFRDDMTWHILDAMHRYQRLDSYTPEEKREVLGIPGLLQYAHGEDEDAFNNSYAELRQYMPPILEEFVSGMFYDRFVLVQDYPVAQT